MAPYRSQSITPKMARERLARAEKRLAQEEVRVAAAREELRVVEARLVREELRTQSDVAAAQRRHAVAVEWERALARARRDSTPPLDARKEERRLARLRRKQETSDVRVAREKAEASEADRRRAAHEVAAARSALENALALEGEK